MKRSTIYLMGLALALLAGCSKEERENPFIPQSESSVSFTEQDIPGQFIVILKADHQAEQRLAGEGSYAQRQATVTAQADKLLAGHGITASSKQFVYSNALVGFTARLNTDEVSRLKADNRVQFIEQDKLITLISGAAKGKPGGGGNQPAQTTPWGITRVGGSAVGTGKTAWIIDSGVDLDHPDLNVDLGKSITFIGGNSTPDDQNGHGTHVAGIVAAKNNTTGTVGVAAGAPVVSVRVLDRRGSGSVSQVISGVDYVAAHAASGDAANMSLGGGVSATLDNAVVNASSKGIWFVLAAGNESDDANNHSPARVNGPYIRTISAMNASDVFASFSNYGTAVDYCAPGVSIYSCWKDGSYNTISGTSMAAPHVTGLILSTNSLATSGYVKNDPDGNADPIAHR